MEFRIPLSYNPVDHHALAEVLGAYENRNHQDLVTDFANGISTLTGAKYVLPVNSGTGAIHLGLRALGVQQGDHVLVSTFTYVGSVNPIYYLGAKPVFIDCEMESGNMDPALLEAAIHNLIKKDIKPKAIIVVHSYGIPARMEEIMKIANQHHVAVLEDAAEAIGASYQQKHPGLFGQVGILSFNNNKILTTFGGGVLLTGDKKIFESAFLWAGQSRENLPFYEHHSVGYNYLMSPLNAAYGLSQFKSLHEKVNERVSAYETYKSMLPESQFLVGPADSVSNRWFIPVVLADRDRMERVKKGLNEAGIEARYLWKPMHLQPAFAGSEGCLNGSSEKLFECGIALPSAFKNREDLPLVIESIKNLLNDYN